ncbi:uromodulin-like, partial [Heptranchias perlo]|uniref:uromodulin-like n=1 Tax=Heptranchias perlo TaxID=212740 RepID=UPI00355942FA
MGVTISASEMRTLLLILVYLTADSALTDPCEDHTVLDQSWRSSDCDWTQCTGQLKSDDKLVQGWYRFKSSGGWKIPETAVPDRHCSTQGPGWLNGSHPTVGQGAVTRTVCFTWDGKNCRWTREIKIKNCTSYFVYELGPTGGHSAYCTAADSALTDPCEDHTVLDQSWRSTDCVETQCIGQWKSDDKLVQGWYRFKSSGGWKIPETAVPDRRCSTDVPGWLNGSHPTVGQGAVTRTVCFTLSGNNCRWNREIKVKNCTSYFVYELGPTGGHTAYCTDPETSTSQRPEEQTTRESAESPSSIPAGSPDSDPETSTSQGPEEQTTRESAESPSSIPAGSADS